MPSPSLLGWWAITADGELVALVREINTVRRIGAIWKEAGCSVGHAPAHERPDVLRLQRGEAILDALDKGGIEVTCPTDMPNEGEGGT